MYQVFFPIDYVTSKPDGFAQFTEMETLLSYFESQGFLEGYKLRGIILEKVNHMIKGDVNLVNTNVTHVIDNLGRWFTTLEEFLFFSDPSFGTMNST